MENYYTNPNPQQDLLTDILDLQQANAGKRFANYLIDLFVYYIFVFLIVFIFASQGAQNILTLTHNTLVDTLLGLCYYGVFMGIYEGLSNGRTLGKRITRTQAVNEDGSRISFQTAFFRGMIRAIPFEAFSALGAPSYPWHDRWTKTYVIDLTKSALPE